RFRNTVSAVVKLLLQYSFTSSPSSGAGNDVQPESLKFLSPLTHAQARIPVPEVDVVPLFAPLSPLPPPAPPVPPESGCVMVRRTTPVSASGVGNWAEVFDGSCPQKRYCPV